jgi:putative membrane protein
MMMGQGFGNYGGYGMGGGSVMMLLGILAIGLLFYLILNKQNNNGSGQYQVSAPQVSSDALELAKSRLANGEISVEEFEQIKKNLL